MLKVAFTGDLCLSGIKRISKMATEKHFFDIKEILSPYDITVSNLECVLSSDSYPDSRMNITFEQCPPLNTTGINVFCLANNHVKDCGEKPIYDVQNYLDKVGLMHVGAGENYSSANKPLLFRRNGLDIGLINVTDASHYTAKKNEAGVAILNSKRLIATAKQLAQTVDAVIVVIHSDLEFTNYPSPWRVKLSRDLSKYCKVIIHHHSHTLQGIEVVNNCVIAYSLGNFIFPAKESLYMKDKPGGIDEGIVFVVGLAKYKDSVTAEICEILPTRIGDFGFLRQTTEFERKITLDRIAEYSLKLTDSSFLRKHHWSCCLKEFKRFGMELYYTFSKYGFIRSLKYIKIHLITDQHRNWLRSFFTFGYK